MGRSTRDTKAEPLAARKEEMEHIMEGTHFPSYDLSGRSPWSGSRRLISKKLIMWNGGPAMNVSCFRILFYFKKCMVWVVKGEQKVSLFLFTPSYPSRCMGFPIFCYGCSWVCSFVTSAAHLISAVDWALCKGYSLHPSLTPWASFIDAFLSPSEFSHVRIATVSKIVICFFLTWKPAS